MFSPFNNYIDSLCCTFIVHCMSTLKWSWVGYHHISCYGVTNWTFRKQHTFVYLIYSWHTQTSIVCQIIWCNIWELCIYNIAGPNLPDLPVSTSGLWRSVTICLICHHRSDANITDSWPQLYWPMKLKCLGWTNGSLLPFLISVPMTTYSPDIAEELLMWGWCPFYCLLSNPLCISMATLWVCPWQHPVCIHGNTLFLSTVTTCLYLRQWATFVVW